MLSNAYFLAKFRFDTAENEPAKNLQNFANFPNFANPKLVDLEEGLWLAAGLPFSAPALAFRIFNLRNVETLRLLKSTSDTDSEKADVLMNRLAASLAVGYRDTIHDRRCDERTSGDSLARV